MTRFGDGERFFAYSPLGDADLVGEEAEQFQVVKKTFEQTHYTERLAGRVVLMFSSLQAGDVGVMVQNPAGHQTLETIGAAIRELESAREYFREIC